MQATGLPRNIKITQEIREIPRKIAEILEERSILANSVTPQFVRDLMAEQYSQIRLLYEPTQQTIAMETAIPSLFA